MSLVQLRHKGKLVEPYAWPMVPETEPPRTLKGLARVVDGGLCHRCGSCVGICPTDVLGLDSDEYPIVKNLSACTDCELCLKVCPGDELDVKAIAEKMFGFVPDLSDMHGHFEKAYIGYANDPKLREDSTSGGLITALLIDLLEAGEIDGALVVGSDSEDRWKGSPRIVRSKQELLATTKSKYAIAPTNVAFQEIRTTPGRYAIVGLPCQIHGFHKAADLDKRLRERVVLTIGLFCHAAIEHEPMRYIWDSLGEDKNNIERFISRVGKHPGTPHIVLKDGTLKPVYFPKATGYRPSSMEILNILYRLYTPHRCLTCFDSTSEFADIAVGDPWMAPPDPSVDWYEGYSFALCRTERGTAALARSQVRNSVVLRLLDSDHARTSNTMMGEEKRWRAFRVLETERRLGKPVPDYGFPSPVPTGMQLIKTEMNMFSHIFCFFPRGRRFILRLSFSELGYRLLWLNNLRRNFRTWRRDTLHAIKRKITKTSGLAE